MENRNYQRFNFDRPISGFLQIHEYKEQKIKCTKFVPVKILNISSGGICFVTNLSFPCSKDYLLQITFGKEKVVGCIVWKQNRFHDYMYGLESTSFNVSFLTFNNELRVFHSNFVNRN